MKQDTIFAPSTAVGGAIAIIRVSGPRTQELCESLLSRVPKPRMLTQATLSYNGKPLDSAMAVYFRAPRSYTGEDMLELHLHGGVYIVRSCLELLSAMGLRPAQAGEFTKRAFLNGKLDLSQAEAVMDLINAEAERQNQSALEQLMGSVGRKTTLLEQPVLDALAAIDAAIDYPDEVEDEVTAELPQRLSDIRTGLEEAISAGRRNIVVREGAKLVLIGAPNAGKSSLMNALLGHERAIVTPFAGTTRDTLDETLVLEGVPLRIVDTAGLREGGSEPERLGIERALQAAGSAQLCLWVVDGTVPPPERPDCPNMLTVINKCDLPLCAEAAALLASSDSVCISAKNREGIESLKKRIAQSVLPTEAESGVITHERQLAALERALVSVIGAQQVLPLELVATDLREALHALGEITGSNADEALIDRIFESFCVGK